MSKKKSGSLMVTCGVNLSTNERTIGIEIANGPGERPFLVVEMTPKDFAEALCSHISRPALIELLS